jgi:hypothetical protein
MEETFSPPVMMTSFLRSEMTSVGPVEIAAVAGVEPATLERRGRLLGLLPVAGEDVVGAGQDLALVVDARSRTPTAGTPARPAGERSAGRGRPIRSVPG